MRLRSVLLLPVLLWLASPAAAGPISYTFTGTGDAQLTGGFLLDDGASWNVGSSSGGVSGVLSSPIQQLWGTYGDYSFQGTASLHVLDRPEFRSDGSDTPGSDYWIVRAALTGPVTNNLAPMALNLFVYTSPGDLNGLSLAPPTHSNSPFDFQFTLSFSDAHGDVDSFAGGALTSLNRVPEPGTLALFGLGAATLLGRRFRRA
jgi:hypothetical protein